jgi:putative transposase
MEEWLESLRLLYNFALAERRDTYKAQARSVSVYQQKRDLPKLKQRFERYAGIHSQVLQDALFRLDKAFKRFFAGGGYPRFKARERYRSFTYPQAPAFQVLEGGKKIRLSGIGNVPIRCHRSLEGKPKTATVTRYPSGKWYVCISCEVADVPIRDAPLSGFDLGLKNYLTSSDGTTTEPLRALKQGEKKLKREQRKLSRKKKGSSNRRKQRHKVARAHEKVANRRRDYLHKTSRKLVDSHEGFAFEKLRVRNMVRNHHLAKAINDAGWTTFVNMAAYKAERAGKPFVLVDPRRTTQECSRCGASVLKTLSDREHVCPSCGLVLDRDHNAAINIQRRAGTVRIDACGEAASTDGESHRQAASPKQEAPSFTAG